MREIQFRGKRAHREEWVYGSLILSGSEVSIWSDDIKDDVEVIPATVGQYTGLTDKNGVRIFEGDIVKLKDYNGARTVEIMWGENHGAWFYGGDWFSDEFMFNASQKEVLGNIHDNPELLEATS